MKVHEQTAAERAKWQEVYKKACQRAKKALKDGEKVMKLIGYC
jgi:hypothetical protein